MRNKCWRSVEPRLHLLCLEDGFDALPDKIRQLGPWMGTHEGNVDQLKLHYRLLMTEQQFVVIYQAADIFSPEPKRTQWGDHVQPL
jgi:hypothetical protein